MPADLTVFLRRAEPDTPPAAGLLEVWQRGRRRRRNRRFGLAGGAACAVAVALVGLVPALDGGDRATQVGAGNEESWTMVAPSPLAPRSGHSVVFTGAEFVVWGGGDESRSFADGAAYDAAADAWRSIAEAPLRPRANHVAAWTGERMIVWGGGSSTRGDPPPGFAGWCPGDAGTDPPTPLCFELFVDGATYDPVADAWTPIADAPVPVSAFWGYQSAWTGSELIVVGRRSETDREALGSMTALAYRPATGTWSVLPDPPLNPNLVTASVWTGEELVLWGSVDHGGREASTEGAAYTPATGTWRTLPAAPLTPRQWHSAAWTGSEMVLWGGTDLVGPDKADGAAYDPRANTWRLIEPAPIGGRYRHVAAFLGGEVVVWGGQLAFSRTGAAYDPATSAWRETIPAPIGYRNGTSGAVGGGRLFVWGGTEGGTAFNDGALYQPGSRPSPGSNTVPRELANDVVPIDPGDGNRRRSDAVVAAEGQIDGGVWRLIVYDSDAGICADLHFDSPSQGGGGGGCGFRVPEERALGASVGGGVDRQFVHGVARDDIVTVRVELGSGRVFDVETLGQDLGYGVRFFATPVPTADAALALIGLNTAGEEVARDSLRPPTETSG